LFDKRSMHGIRPMKMHSEFWLENFLERDNLGDEGVDGWIMYIMYLQEIRCKSVVLGGVQWRTFLNKVMNLQVHLKRRIS